MNMALTVSGSASGTGLLKYTAEGAAFCMGRLNCSKSMADAGGTQAGMR